MDIHYYFSKPVYGLDAAILPAPWGALLSILLLVGVWRLGNLILLALREHLGSTWSLVGYHSGLVGVTVLTCMVFPLALAGVFSRSIAALLATGLAILGLVGVPFALRSAQFWLAEWKRSAAVVSISKVCMAMLAGYFLLALAPITEADSLDYHVGVALRVLNTGAFPADPAWFSSRLAGAGETLIALGLAIGAEQFGSLLQWMGLSSVAKLILTFGTSALEDSQGTAADERRWLILLLLSTPVFVAWVASPKPMLLPGAMTTLALCLSYQIFNSKVQQSAQFTVMCGGMIFSLLFVAVNMKFSFSLSAGLIIGLTLVYQMRRRRLTLTLLALFISALFVYGPFLIWKWVYFGGNLLDLLTTPLPGAWPGTSEFLAYLKNYRDSSLPAPISLVVPNRLGNLTTVLGVGLVLSLAAVLYKRVWGNPLVLLAGFMTVLGILLGQVTSRFFLEPYYWCILGILVSGSLAHMRKLSLTAAKMLLALQGLVVAVMILVGIVTISSGSLHPELRTQVMRLAANDYSTMIWVDKVLPQNAAVLSDVRSVALIPRQAYSTDFKTFTATNSLDRRFYLSKIDWSDAPFFLLTTQVTPDSLPKACLGEMFAGPFLTETGTRNPWNRGASYQVWLYEVRKDCLVGE